MKKLLKKLGHLLALVGLLLPTLLTIAPHIAFAVVPDTTITYLGQSPSKSSTANFILTSDQSATFDCKLDADSYLPCNSAYTVNSLTNGSHTLRALATNGDSEVDSTPAIFTWTVDTTPSISGASDVSGRPNHQTAISDIHIDGAGTVPVHLEVENGELLMTNTSGLTFDGDLTGSSLSFSGTVEDVNAALATLQYTTGSIGADTLNISLRGSNQIMYGDHAYEVISTVCDEEGGGEGCVSWNDARAAAGLRSYLGVPGYLASITSSEENSYLATHLTGGASWIGSSDSVEEGTWKWVDGPDDGLHFWTGEGEYGGATEPGQYSNWNPGEPNNASPAENCGEMYAGDTTGFWNDLPCDSAMLGSYMVEYGDDTHTVTIPSDSLEITTTQPIADDVTINDCEQLQAINDLDNTYGGAYVITHNIDCSMTNPDSSNFDPEGTWGDGLGFVPIGRNIAFQGIFNGNTYKISDLYINRPEESLVGLFDTTTEDASISGIRLINPTITGSYDTGAVIGDNEGAPLSNISVTGLNLTGTSSATGGIVGYSQGSSADNIHADGTVTSSGEETGGLFGYFNDGELSNCSFDGDVQGEYETGGIVGEIEDDASVITRCFTSGSVTSDGDTDAGGILGEAEADGIVIDESFSTSNIEAPENAGGIVGYVGSEIEIVNSYARGSVTAEIDTGGIVGDGYEFLTITNSFATGQVTGDESVGGVVGDEDDGSYNQVFWDTQTSQQSDGCDDPGSCTDLIGKSTDLMKTKATFTSELGEGAWNFDGDDPVWGMTTDGNDGYPCLRWTVYSCHSSDLDIDGTLNSVENAGPNDGDANNDGTLDSLQAHVSTMHNSSTNQYASLVTDCANHSSVGIDSESTSTKDAGYDYSAGLISFTADCPISPATVTQYFFGTYDASKFVARKYNSVNRSYSTITGAVLSNVTVGGQAALKIVYQIDDNGILDQNPVVGTITDPAGPGLAIGVPSTGLDSRY